MKISIITVCYNSEKYIRSAIESVLNQTYENIEYILIDGGSKDTTMDIVKSYELLFNGRMKWISEPDDGIYDAMNKGITISSGDIIGILNSDDYYASADVLSTVCDLFYKTNIDSCYGNLLYVKNDKPYRYWKAGNPQSFFSGWMPPHPAFFVKREVYLKYGFFRIDCGTTADYELMLRFIEINRISITWINKLFIYMRVGGVSNSGLRSRITAYKNDKKSWLLNNYNISIVTIFLKKIRKFAHFFRARFSIV